MGHVLERTKLEVGPGSAASVRSFFRTAAAKTFLVRALGRCAECIAGGSYTCREVKASAMVYGYPAY